MKIAIDNAAGDNIVTLDYPHLKRGQLERKRIVGLADKHDFIIVTVIDEKVTFEAFKDVTDEKVLAENFCKFLNALNRYIIMEVEGKETDN